MHILSLKEADMPKKKSIIDLKTKDELVQKLKDTINQLNNFIKIAEDLSKTKQITPQMQEFINLLKNFKNIPEELKYAPILIEETVKYLEGIVNEIHHIRVQIESSFTQESTLRNAVNVLDKIPDSTFKATDQILNTLDNIMSRESEMLEIINVITENKEKLGTENIEKVDRLLEVFTENQNNHFIIMDALQFQDITTQQIQHVNDLLEKTELKLSELVLKLKGLDEADIKFIIENAKKQERVYDPNAEFTKRETEQQFADQLYQKNEEKKHGLEQDDIENLLTQFGK